MAFTPRRQQFQSFGVPGGGGPRRGPRGRPGPVPRSSHNTPYASYEGVPPWGSPQGGLYPVDERYAADPGPGQLAGGWQTGRVYPEEYVEYPDYGHVEGTPFDALPRDLRPEPDHSWGRGTQDWYGWGAGGQQQVNDGRRLYNNLPQYFQDDSDNVHSRNRWREELLTGDPEKVMAENAGEAATLVISFITRGSPQHPHGQGCVASFRLAGVKQLTLLATEGTSCCSSSRGASIRPINRSTKSVYASLSTSY